jgi:hypothetical protein
MPNKDETKEKLSMRIQRSGYFFSIGFSFAICVMLIAGCGDSKNLELPTTSLPTMPPASLPPANVAGSWTGTFEINDPMGECGPNLSLAAEATFKQNGSTITGTLKAAGACGLSYPLQGTMKGNALRGTLTGGLDPAGQAMGTLSGSTFQIATFNGYNRLMGTMHLHR